MPLIIHLVPQLPPAICGLGDYAVSVGAKIEDVQPDVRCAYIACGYRNENEFNHEPARRNLPRDCDAEGLWHAVGELVDELAGGAVDRVSLLLHYSGYGYHAGGAPAWLAEALETKPRP